MPSWLVAALLLFQNLTPRPVPPQGVKVSDSDRASLTAELKRLGAAIDSIKGSPLLNDVRIYHEAVRVALTYDEFFRADDVSKARDVLRQGMARVDEIRNGRVTWPTATGLVVRGYESRLDRSVQPYGLVVPPTWDPKLPRRWRLDVWLHGRSENLNEISFIYDRQRSPGEFQPEDTIVLHTYGRYNNANKFGGEVDVFEAIADVKKHYKIDENRILLRGFSMGGASSWQLGTHHAGIWAAVAPGAGFAETPVYTKIMQDPVKPTAWEQTLWHLYNATDYAANLYNTAVVAYSGEIDKQKAAADTMAKYMAAEGMTLTHIIGPNTEHKYHPDSKVIIARLLDQIAEKGRDPYPKSIRFTTWTLRYNRMKWLVVDGLDKHWERARLDADVTGENTIRVKAENVAAFTVDMGPGSNLIHPAASVDLVVNGQQVKVPGPMSDRSFTASLVKSGTKWAVAPRQSPAGLRKVHGLQGPIDDAFFDSFVFVKPTGAPRNELTGKWVASESARAIKEWRRHFRGEPQVRDDNTVTDADIANSNLILWGDPSSNKLIARIMDKLPVKWPAEQDRALIMIYPNPLNPKHYVVLNSGITYREADYSTNAREVPKLPDWAVVDLNTPPDASHPGKIVAADFFDELWKIRSAR